MALLLRMDRPGFGRKRRQGGGAAAEGFAGLSCGAGGECAGNDGDEADTEGGEADDSEPGGVTHDILPLCECYNVT
jgi:hypothetical protein